MITRETYQPGTVDLGALIGGSFSAPELEAYSPDQPRDEQGRFGFGTGTTSDVGGPTGMPMGRAKFTETVDARRNAMSAADGLDSYRHEIKDVQALGKFVCDEWSKRCSSTKEALALKQYTKEAEALRDRATAFLKANEPLYEKRQELYAQLDKVNPSSPEGKTVHADVMRQLDELRNQIRENAQASNRIYDDAKFKEKLADMKKVDLEYKQLELALKVLGEARASWGGLGGATPNHSRDDAGNRYEYKLAARSLLDDVAKRFPTDWLQRSAWGWKMDVDFVKSRGYYSGSAFGKAEINLGQLVNDPRASMSFQDRANFERVAAHELGHHMEDVLFNVHEFEARYYDMRTRGEKDVPLSKVYPSRGYSSDELTREDQWASAYMGKNYGHSDKPYAEDRQFTAGQHYEIVSMGFEKLFTKPAELGTGDRRSGVDQNYRYFIWGLAVGVKAHVPDRPSILKP